MKLGYVTNGFATHALDDIIVILSDIGYRSIAISLDRFCLNPFEDEWVAEARRIRRSLEDAGLSCVVETGARFLLDPRRKHQPTLVSRRQEDRDRRIEFLSRAIEVGVELNAGCVSLWSGAPDDDAGQAELFDRLCDGLSDVVGHAERYDMPLGFEPEPGMLIERMADYARLRKAIDHPLLRLTLDVGHVHCLDDGDLLGHVTQWRDQLCNVHIEDMNRGRHEHLMFGDGEMNFTEVVGVLTAVRYAGPVHVELSRHSHDAPAAAAKAFAFLSALWPK